MIIHIYIYIYIYAYLDMSQDVSVRIPSSRVQSEEKRVGHSPCSSRLPLEATCQKGPDLFYMDFRLPVDERSWIGLV